MANRFQLRQFAGNASNTGVFGSYNAGNPTYSSNPVTIQQLPAWLTGWIDATSTGTLLPRLEEMQGVQKVLCEAILENYREGLPLWLATESYYQYSIVAYIGSDGLQIYYNATGNYSATPPDEDTANWQNLSTILKPEGMDQYIPTSTITNCLLGVDQSCSFQQLTGAYYNLGCDINGQNITGFSVNNSILLTAQFPTAGEFGWVIKFTFNTTNVTPKQVIMAMPTMDNSFGIVDGKFYISLNGVETRGNYIINPRLAINCQLIFNGSSYILQVENGGQFTNDIIVSNATQPWAGKSTYIGWGGNDYTENYFRGSVVFPQILMYTNDAGATSVYWNNTTSTTANIIHFNGTFDGLAPNGRNTDRSFNNERFEQSVNSYMFYTPVNKTKTLLVTTEGELMARENYYVSDTAPESPKLNDVWFDTENNILSQFNSMNPNFTTTTGCTVNRGSVSFTGSGSLTLTAGLVTESNIANAFETYVTVGSDITSTQGIAKFGDTSTSTQGASALYVSEGSICWALNLRSYEVGINTGSTEAPVWENLRYVPELGVAMTYVPAGRDYYSDVICDKRSGNASGSNYLYTGNTASQVITLKVRIDPSTSYSIHTQYLAGNYTLLVGATVAEQPANALIGFTGSGNLQLGGSWGLNNAVPKATPFKGFISLANTLFDTWVWNGASSSSSTWNVFKGCVIGTVTDNGTRITDLTIYDPIELVNKVDFNNLQQSLDVDLTQVNKRIDDTNTALQNAKSALEEAMSALETDLNGQMSALDTRLTGAMSALDTKLQGDISALDTKLTGQVSDLDTKLTSKIDTDVSNLNTTLTGQINNLNTDLTGKINTVQSNLTAFQGKFQVVNSLPSSPDASTFYFVLQA